MGKLKNTIINIICIATFISYFVDIKGSNIYIDYDAVEIGMFCLAFYLIVIVSICIKDKQNVFDALIEGVSEVWTIAKTYIPVFIIITIILEVWLS
jgi:hypothetical protein